jgi:tryptophanyl-tRNA synthetase
MSKSMGNKTAAIYLRKSTEDGRKSVANQEHDTRIRGEQLGVEVVAVEPQSASVLKTTKDGSYGAAVVRLI